MIDAKQVRAARALLNWSQADLVERAKLSPTTIKRMEADSIGPGKSAAENVARVQDAFEAAGVIFIASNGEGAGVRMRKVSE